MLDYKSTEHQLAYNEKQKQREAWRTYAAAALASEKYDTGGSAEAADLMLAEENKRFNGGDDES